MRMCACCMCNTNSVILCDDIIFVCTHRLANAREIRGCLIICTNCVSATVVQNITADMILHTLAHTIAVITAYADAFIATVAGRYALRVHVALRKIC